MSFLLDAPLLAASGAVISRTVDDPRRRRLAETATVTLFVASAASLYLNAPWMRGVWEATGAASGRDLMVNSWLFGVEHERPSLWVHGLSALALASYPLWLRLGSRLGGRSR